MPKRKDVMDISGSGDAASSSDLETKAAEAESKSAPSEDEDDENVQDSTTIAQKSASKSKNDAKRIDHVSMSATTNDGEKDEDHPVDSIAIEPGYIVVDLPDISFAFSDEEIEWDDDDEDDDDDDDAGEETNGSTTKQRSVTEALLSSRSNGSSKKRARAGGSCSKSKSKSKKEPVRNRVKRASARRLKQHRVELLYLLGQCLLYNEQCDNRGLHLSFGAVIPSPFKLDPLSFSLQNLRSFLKWFQMSFEETTPPPSSNPRCTALGRLPGIVDSRKSSKLERVQVFVIMLRAMNVPARLVMCLFPREKTAAAPASAKNEASRPHVWAEVWVPVVGRGAKDAEIDWNEGQGEWTHVSVNEGCGLDSPGFYHAQLGKGAFTLRKRLRDEAAYIVGLSQFNYAMDVTLRYTSRPSVLMKRRCTSTRRTVVTQFHTGYQEKLVGKGGEAVKACWWEGYILGWLRHCAASTAVMQESTFESAAVFKLLQQAMSQEAFEAEREKLQRCAMDEQLPTSEAGFRHHAMFVLEKHLRKHEALLPNAKHVTFFKAHKVFRRTHVAILFSRKKWKLAGRVVKEAELDQPMKQWKWKKRSRGGGEAGGGGGGGTDASSTPTLNLYARGQTEEMQRPRLDNGKLPRNKYGNIEILCDKMIPLGATVVDSPFALQAAKKLNVDYLRVVIGFERRYPKFGGKQSSSFLLVFTFSIGILVLDEAAVLVKDAAQELLQASVTKKEQQRHDRVMSRWKGLIQLAIERRRLNDTYNAAAAASTSIDLTGDAEEQENAQEQEQARVQVRKRRRKACNHQFKADTTEEDGVRVDVQRCVNCGQVRESEIL